MPALLKTEFSAEVVWLGIVADRKAALSSAPVDRLDLRFDGVAGDSHSGLTRPSCARVTSQHRPGTEIRNTRQVSILSDEELAQIADAMGLERLEPAWLGATMVLRGLPALSVLPPSSRLQSASGSTLVIDMENRPCQLPAKIIKALHPKTSAGFKNAARGRRGVTAWVEREGSVALGERLTLHVPDQPCWPHLGTARGLA